MKMCPLSYRSRRPPSWTRQGQQWVLEWSQQTPWTWPIPHFALINLLEVAPSQHGPSVNNTDVHMLFVYSPWGSLEDLSTTLQMDLDLSQTNPRQFRVAVTQEHHRALYSTPCSSNCTPTVIPDMKRTVFLRASMEEINSPSGWFTYNFFLNQVNGLNSVVINMKEKLSMSSHKGDRRAIKHQDRKLSTGRLCSGA